MANPIQTHSNEDESQPKKRGRPRKQVVSVEEAHDEEQVDLDDLLEEEEHDDDTDEHPTMPEPQALSSVPAPPSETEQAFDLFVDVGQYWLNHGALVSYTIIKDNVQMGTRQHPYSWDKMQEEFGEGYYKVQARDARKKTFLKQESRLLGSPPRLEKTEQAADPVKALLQRQLDQQAGHQAPAPGLSIAEVLSFMDKAESKAKAAADSQMQMMMGMFTKMMDIQKSVVVPAAAALPVNNDPVLALMRDQIARQDKIIEKLTDKLDDASKRSAKGDSIGTLEMMRMQKEAEADAFKRWEMLDEMSERKAEQKLESRGESSGEKEDESLMKTVVKSLVPIMGAAYQQSQATGAEQASLPNNTKSAYPARRRIPPAPGIPSRATGHAPGTIPVQSRPMTIPSAVGKPMSNLGPRKGGPATPEELSMREKIFAVAGPMIASMLPSGVSPDTAAREVCDVLAAEGIAALDVVSVFPLDAFLEVAKSKGVPAIANPWLRRFHGAVELAARQPQKVNPPEPVETSALAPSQTPVETQTE